MADFDERITKIRTFLREFSFPSCPGHPIIPTCSPPKRGLAFVGRFCDKAKFEVIATSITRRAFWRGITKDDDMKLRNYLRRHLVGIFCSAATILFAVAMVLAFE